MVQNCQFYLFLLVVCIIPTVFTNRTSLTNPNRMPKWKVNRKSENQGPYYAQPEQVHLSYGGEPSIVIVTWLTFDDTINSVVKYGTEFGNLNNSVIGKMDYFDDGGFQKSRRYTHRVTINNIQAGTRYFYQVGSEFGWSSAFSFIGLKPRKEGGYKFAVYGDLGNVNGRSLGKLQRLAHANEFDMVLHVGDFAYDMATDQGRFGDEFMRQIEPIAAYVPYMTVVGNHEFEHNFTHYINRFTMPNTRENLFYSFDIGHTHFVIISTEFYFFIQYGLHQLHNQWDWLIADLEKANKNRQKVPWIITLGHRPMYCSDFDGDDCTRYNSIIRTGLPIIHSFALEKLFYKYGVDLEIWAHEHTFERMYPVYNRIVFNETSNPYLDPPAPVHVVTGSAGCQEGTDTFVIHPGPWSAFRSTNYGFSLMQVFNETHIKFEQTLAYNDTVEDDFWLIKHKHKPYTRRDQIKLQRHGTYIPEDYCHHLSQCGKTKHAHL